MVQEVIQYRIKNETLCKHFVCVFFWAKEEFTPLNGKRTWKFECTYVQHPKVNIAIPNEWKLCDARLRLIHIPSHTNL